MKSNKKFHYISDQIADLVLANKSSSTLTPELKGHGVFNFDYDSQGNLLGTIFGHPCRLVLRKAYQSSSEGNSRVSLIAMKELLINSSEACMELDYAKHDLEDYQNVMKKGFSYDSKYEFNNIREALAHIPNALEHDSRIVVASWQGNANHTRTFSIQDLGIGVCGESFENNFAFANRQSTKRNVNWFTGMYGMGLTGVTQFQDHSTPRFRTIFSKRHPDLLDDFEVVSCFGHHWHLSVSCVLGYETFDIGGAFEGLPKPNNRGYDFGVLELQTDNGWSHPICSESYDFSPRYDRPKNEHFESPNFGTHMTIYDYDIHANSAQVCNIQKKITNAKGSLNDNRSVTPLARAFDQIHPFYPYQIKLFDQVEHYNPKKKGGSSSYIQGLESRLEEKSDEVDFIMTDYEMQVNFIDQLETIKCDLVYTKNACKTNDKSLSAFVGIKHKINDVFARFESRHSVAKRLGLPNDLGQHIFIVLKYDKLSEKNLQKAHRSNRDQLGWEDEIMNNILNSLKDLVLKHPKVQELLDEYSDDASLNSIDDLNDEDFDIFSDHLFANFCKSTKNKPTPDTKEYFDTLSELEIKPTSLAGRIIGGKRQKYKIVVGKQNFHLSFIHNAKSEVVQKHGFDTEVKFSFDNGTTWSKGIAHNAITHQDGRLKISNLSVPTSDQLLSQDNTFQIKCNITPRNGSDWVDSQLDRNNEFSIHGLLEDMPVINKPNNPKTPNPKHYGFSPQQQPLAQNCPLQVGLLNAPSDLYNGEDYKYFITQAESESDDRFMTENDYIGFTKSGNNYKVVFNGFHTELSNSLQGLGKDSQLCLGYIARCACKQIISRILIARDSDMHDFSYVNDMFPFIIQSAIVTWNKTLKSNLASKQNKAKKVKKNNSTTKPKSLSRKKTSSTKKQSSQKA